MLKILIQKFEDGRPKFDRYPRNCQEAINMELPEGVDVILIHKSNNIVNVIGITREFIGEEIVL